MPARSDVKCSQCGSKINRVTWNYGKNRPISEFFCNSSCKGDWQKARREALGYTKEWLESEYHSKGKSANQIAREIGRDPKRVWEWIRDYGLKTRPRGNEYGQGFIAGSESPFKGMRHTEETKEKIRVASIADGRVPYLKDGKHWLKHEGAISPAWRGGVTPERQAFYSTPEWCEAVKSVWSRDNATCQMCGKHHNEAKNRGTFHIHHIVSFMVEEKRSDPGNLVLLCKECHRWVHSKRNKHKIFIEG